MISRHCGIGVPTCTSSLSASYLPIDPPLKGITYNTVRRAQPLRLTIQLIPITLDVIQPICHDDCIPSQRSLHSTVVRPSSLFLCPGFAIGRSRDVESLVVDVDDLEARDGGDGGIGDAGLEVGEELVGAVGFAGGGVAR